MNEKKACRHVGMHTCDAYMRQHLDIHTATACWTYIQQQRVGIRMASTPVQGKASMSA